MDTKLHEVNGLTITELVVDTLSIQTAQDALDIMATTMYGGSRRLIWHEHQLNPDFFELKSGLAGEILQKFSNYGMKLAVVSDTEKFQSNSLNAFVLECNRGNQVFFSPDLATALEKLSG
ncbi:MAG: DUF4180 domain-containing protein [Trueperaceae bacterium]|nr:DUF4180 domain-containing protein [Trueperaceae bacterium]